LLREGWWRFARHLPNNRDDDSANKDSWDEQQRAVAIPRDPSYLRFAPHLVCLPCESIVQHRSLSCPYCCAGVTAFM